MANLLMIAMLNPIRARLGMDAVTAEADDPRPEIEEGDGLTPISDRLMSELGGAERPMVVPMVIPVVMIMPIIVVMVVVMVVGWAAAANGAHCSASYRLLMLFVDSRSPSMKGLRPFPPIDAAT